MEIECEHDWEFIADWEGDSSLPNGTRDLSHWRCLACDLEQIETPEGIEPSCEPDYEDEDRLNRRGEHELDYTYDPLRRDP